MIRTPKNKVKKKETLCNIQFVIKNEQTLLLEDKFCETKLIIGEANIICGEVGHFNQLVVDLVEIAEHGWHAKP